MKKPKIKFSHRYEKIKKIQNHDEVLLLEVIPINLKNLSKPMRLYDTHINDDEFYTLPKSGEYLLLIFLDHNAHLFTTIRSAYPERKIEYYKEKIGIYFEIEINE